MILRKKSVYTEWNMWFYSYKKYRNKTDLWHWKFTFVTFDLGVNFHATHPDVQQKLQEEIDATFPNKVSDDTQR